MAFDLTNDEQVTAATAWGEARGEGGLGIQAVISVISNRVNIARATRQHEFGGGGCAAKDADGNSVEVSPATFAAACLQPWQFSSWNIDDPNRAQILALDFDNPDEVLSACITYARQALAGELSDNTGGATFYKTTSLPWPEEWGPEVDPVTVIGHQSFYKLA